MKTKKKTPEEIERREWRKKNLALVYFGKDMKRLQNAEEEFWRSASSEAKHLAISEFVRDELERQGLTEYGPKLLRLTSIVRRT